MKIDDLVEVSKDYKHFSHAHLDLKQGDTGYITGIGNGTDETMQHNKDFVEFDHIGWYPIELFKECD